MISLSDIPELVGDFAAKNITWRDFSELLVDLLQAHEVRDVVALLPPELALRFTGLLRDDFDNDTPAVEFLWLDTARGEHPAKVLIIMRARTWLAANKGG